MNAQRRQGGGSVSESARQSGMVTDGGPVNEMGMQRQRAKKCGSHRRMRSNHTARTHFTLPGGWGSWGGWGGASRAGDAQSFLVFALLALTACKPTVTTPLDHRPSDPACSLGAPLGSLTTGGSCDATADCTPAPHVACIPYEEAGASFCNYDACEVDTDCPDGGICICATATDGTTVPTTPNTCLAAGNCRIDADCPTVPYCSPSSTGCSTTVAYYCHTPNDDCGNDADCRTGDFCLYAPGAAKWTCVSGTACDQVAPHLQGSRHVVHSTKSSRGVTQLSRANPARNPSL